MLDDPRSGFEVTSWRGASLGLLLALCGSQPGCGPQNEAYFPLKKGAEWTYQVRSGFVSRIETVRATKQVPVGGSLGWLLESPACDSSVAWIGDQLLAAELAGTRFVPPVPILSFSDRPSSGEWQGLATVAGRTYGGTAKLLQAKAKFPLGSKVVTGIHATLRLDVPTGPIEVWSWYVDGIGLVRQEQRDRSGLARSLEYVKGP